MGAKTEYWSLIIGLVMMVMVLLLPRGLAGEFQLLKARMTSAPVESRGRNGTRY